MLRPREALMSLLKSPIATRAGSAVRAAGGLVSLLGLAACGKTVCDAGATQLCNCPNGEVGAQSCNIDGDGWDPCECDGA